MPAPSEDPGKVNLDDALIRIIRERRVSDLTSAVDACEDPIVVAASFMSAMKRLYREHKEVTSMLAAGGAGLNYCLAKANHEPDGQRARELRKRAHGIAYNTAVNCWPGWGDAGIVIEEGQISAGIEIAATCLNLTQELALTPREQGGAHWLIGALELAAGRFRAARAAFEEARVVYLGGQDLAAYALMAEGYIALAIKADPQSGSQGRDVLNEALDRLRVEGSKDAIFFADQIATADRVLSNN